MNQETIRSTCIFGSVARGSSDVVSDKDVLIVVANPQNNKELVSKWKALGWSVSLYTPRRLDAIINHGSLFVQHLKHEGLILEDSDNWLKERLQSAQPKSSYLFNAYSSVDLALPIERFASDLSIDLNPIVADLAFVSIRNFAINYLAHFGVFAFDYDNVVSEVGVRLGLTFSDIDLLRSLRFGKAKYRATSGPVPVTGTVRQLRGVLNKVFKHRPLVEIDLSTPVRTLQSGYATLRDYEAYIVSRLDRTPSTQDLKELRIEEVWKWISKPQDYAWGVRQYPGPSKLEMAALDQTIGNGAFPTKNQGSFDPSITIGSRLLGI